MNVCSLKRIISSFMFFLLLFNEQSFLYWPILFQHDISRSKIIIYNNNSYADISLKSIEKTPNKQSVIAIANDCLVYILLFEWKESFLKDNLKNTFYQCVNFSDKEWKMTLNRFSLKKYVPFNLTLTYFPNISNMKSFILSKSYNLLTVCKFLKERMKGELESFLFEKNTYL